MATTVTYKSNTLTTATNETKILKTAGKYMEDNVTITDSTIVPSGTYTVSASGSADITNYATLSVPSAGKITAYYYHDFSNEMGVNDNTGQVGFFSEGTGNLLHCESSGWVDSGDILNSEFAYEVLGVKQLSTQAATTITPTESTQTAVAKGKFTTGAVTVAGISSDYVGSGITRRGNVDLTINGPTFQAPAGYYSSAAAKTMSGATLSSPSITYDDELLYIVTRASTAGYVASGTVGTSVVNITTINSLPTKSAQTYTPTTTNQTIAAQQWLTGAQTIKGDANLIASNIASGVSIFGVNGTHQGGASTYSVIIGFEDIDDPNEYATDSTFTISSDDAFIFKQEYLSVTPSSSAQHFSATNPWGTSSQAGYYEVYVAGDSDLVSSNIKSGVSIFGVSGSSNIIDTTYNSSTMPIAAPATAGDILLTKHAFVNGSAISGTITPMAPPLRTYISTVSGTVAVGSGYFAEGFAVSISSTEQAKIISGNIKSGVTILGISGDSNVVNTSDATAAASQILTGKTAYVAGSKRTGTMSNRGAAQYSIATKSDVYTILAGYHNGSGTVFINWDEQDKIIAGNIKSGVTILGVTGTYTGGGGSGLEYEEGTYSPTSDIARPTISFSKTHSTLPRYIGMQATSGAGQSSSNFGWFLYNYDILNSAGVSYNGTTAIHGQVQWAHRSNSTAIASGGRTIAYGQSNTGANTSTYIRYWATESNFKPYSASTTRYWRSGHTYKWVAVW